MPNTRRRRPGRARNGNGRSRADKQLAQGTGRTVSRPFSYAPRGPGLRCWDAFDPRHAALPRATGPYTVVRTTRLLESSGKFAMIGSFKRLGFPDAWSSVVYVDDVVSSQPVSGNNNANVRNIPIPGGSDTAPVTLTAVPSAISVQVMNPEAMQTTTGIVAMGVCNTQLDINNRTESWDTLSNEFISFFKPRLCSAGKLALRGVQINSYPLNMSAISDFRPIVPSGDNQTTLDGNKFAPEGWAPIVIVNENGVSLQLLITVEWRVRFDIGNPAVASHQHHGVTSDSSWNKMLRDAVSLGNGVMDIVERVASAGQAVAALTAPPRGRLMLT